MKNTHKIIAFLAGAVLLITGVMAASFWAFSQIDKAAEAQKHTFIVIHRANDLMSALIDAETGQRGYLLTGDKTFLEPYLAVRGSILGDLKELRKLSLNIDAHKHLDALVPLINAKLAYLSHNIELRSKHEIVAALTNIRSSQDKRLMDSIRAEMSNFILIEEGALAQHNIDFKLNMRRMFIAIVITSLITLLLALSFVYFIYRETQQEAAEIKSKFTSMVSHELRSPLAAIKEGANILLEGLAGSITGEQKDMLAIVKRNADRLGRLINNVLDFQKFQAGKMEYDIKENDINEAVRDACATMHLLVKDKGLDFSTDLDAGIPKLKFDLDKIIQVVTNIVSNAIKVTEKGSISIITKQEGSAVHVTVRDTGPGISRENLNKLFMPFERLDVSKDKRKGGTGLGLAISKEIILAHKGKIWAESEEGKGSAFHFTLPINE